MWIKFSCAVNSNPINLALHLIGRFKPKPF